MKTLQDLENELNTMRVNYEANPLPMGDAYRNFVKKFKAKQSQINSYNSVANQIKRAGIKVTKTRIGYQFNGNKVVAEVYLDGCETDYWTFYSEGDWNTADLEVVFETKSDVMQYLLTLELNS